MRSRRLSTGRDSRIGNPGESSNPMTNFQNLGFIVPHDILEGGTFASGASDPQVLAPASVEFPGSNGTPAPVVLLRSDGVVGVQDEVLAEPFQPHQLSVPRGHVPVSRGVDSGECSVELGSDRSSVREARQ